MSAIYTVVTIDGQEHSNLDSETVKRWFFERNLLEDSFVMSSETGQWKIMKKEFDLNQWINHTQQPQQQHQPQQQWNAPPQQQWDASQQSNSQQQTAQWNAQQYQQPYSQPMPQQQNWNAQQPQQAWVSQQNWVAPPPPSSPNPVFIGAFESGSSRASLAANSMKVLLVFTALLIIINLLIAISPPNIQGIERGHIDESLVGLLIIAGLVGLGSLVVSIVTIILYLMWLHRAFRNLRALGQQTEYSPGWAVGYWFIPFINLVMPYRIVNELYEKSDFQGNNSSSIVSVWWLTYILSILIGWIANLMTSGDAMATAAMVDVVSGILAIIAGFACIRIINTVNEMHEDRIVESQNGYARPSARGYQPNYN